MTRRGHMTHQTGDCDCAPPHSSVRAMKRVVAVGLSAGLISAPLCAEPRADVATAASEAIRRLDLQTELPRDPTPQPKLHVSFPPELVLLPLILVIACVIYAFRDQLGRLRLLGRGPEWRADRHERSADLPAAEGLASTAKADDLAGQG